MKKRSLFAAVAMLIVSAVVLTSATYAWFAASSTATVTGFEAKISNSDGSLLVSGDSGGSWGYTLALADITAANKDLVPSGTNDPGLIPVSVTPSWVDTNNTNTKYYKVVGGGFGQDGETWTGAAAAAGTQYSSIRFKIKSTVDAQTVTGSISNLTVNYKYVRAAVYVDGELAKVYGHASASSYYPIKWTAAYAADATTLTGTDATPKNFIMDSTNDTTYPTLDSQFTDTVNSGSFTFGLTAETPVDVEIIIWAEGQDPDCVGAASGTAISFGLSFTKS